MNILEYSPYFDKSPKGAVSTEEEVRIRCKLKKDYSFQELIFYLRDDNNNTIINNKMNLYFEDEDYFYFNIKFNLKNSNIYFYHFIATYSDRNISFGHIKYIPTTENYFEWQLTVYQDTYKTPSWFKGGIMYQIFPDRFARDKSINISFAKNENERIKREDWGGIPNSVFDTKNYSAKDFFLGNLKGIENKIGYLKDLNVDSVYLNPIFESAENHRYSTGDYFKIDPYLGTFEDFKSLKENFKKNNISLILDGVFSHTGSDSIYFNKNHNYESVGAFNSKESKYFSWFDFIEYPNKYNSWWGFDNLPTINKNNKEFMEFINGKHGVLEYWENNGVDGWRLDVADEFPASFLENLRKSVKSRNENHLIIGEVWENASNKISYGERRKYILGSQLDSVMNYPFRKAILNFLKDHNSYNFKFEIEDILETYPRQTVDCLMNMLSTHDTTRAILELAINVDEVDAKLRANYVLSEGNYNKAKSKFKIATMLQFTLPGVPSIYYGDEVGMYGFSDPFNRKCFEEDKIDFDLLNYFKKLSSFRKKYRNEFLKDFEILVAKDECISYKIGKLIIIVNLNKKAIYSENINIYNAKDKIIFGNGKIAITEMGSIIKEKSCFIIEALGDEKNE